MIRLSLSFKLVCALETILCTLAIAQWRQVYGSYGGPTQVVIIASHDSSGTAELFAGTDHGPFNSADNGASWWAVNGGMQTFVRAMASNDLATYLVRVGVDPWTSSSSLGVVYTTDHGLTWLPIDSTWNIPNIYALAGLGNNLYVGLDSGLMITSNNSLSWRKCDSIGAKFLTVKCDASGDTTILALTTSVMRSSDNGTTWTKALAGGTVFIPPRTYLDRPLFSLAAHDSLAFAGSQGKVYGSTDDGKSWSAGNPLPEPLNTIGITAVAADDSDLYATTGPNLFRSTDRGVTWTSCSSGLPHGNYLNEQLIRSLSMDGSILYAATVAGVFCSTDHGTTWVARNSGLDVMAPASLATGGNFVYATLGSGYFLGRSSDHGETWTVLNDMPHFHFRSLAANGPHVVAGTDAPVLQNGYSPAWRSSDHGTTWTIDMGGIQAFTPNEYGINDTYIFAGMVYGGMGIYRCHLDSSTWTPLTGLYRITVEGISVNGPNLVAGTFSQGMFLSSDNGEHWTSNSAGQDYTELAFNILTMNGSTIFAGTSQQVPPGAPLLRKGGVWCSTDGGSTWVNKGLSGNNITGLSIVGPIVIAATDSCGIRISSDNGNRWWPLNNGLPHYMVSSLIANDEYLYAGVPGGIWRLPLSEAIASVPPENKGIPSHFALEQNYPNPFNPRTGVRFQVSGVSDVKLTVYDLLGREVAVLVNEKKAPGTYEVRFDAAGLASGVYLCRMTTGTFVQVMKMVLVR